jgi:hypothetical protein
VGTGEVIGILTWAPCAVVLGVLILSRWRLLTELVYDLSAMQPGSRQLYETLERDTDDERDPSILLMQRAFVLTAAALLIGGCVGLVVWVVLS